MFRRFIGDVNPFLAIGLGAALAVVLLWFLASRGWFAIHRQGMAKGRLATAAVAALFAAITILVDLKVVFPLDLNAPFPESLWFYPTIGFLVEVLFHLLPLTLLLVLLTAVGKRLGRRRILFICIPIVASLEPLYQSLTFAAAGHFPSWVMAFVAVHLFLFNLFELLVFARYDFVAMYSSRVAYYVVWHIAWGYFRLRVLPH